MRRLNLATLLVVAGLAAAALVLSERSKGSEEPTAVRAVAASGWQGLVGAPRAAVAVGERVLVVLRGPSLSTRVAAAGGFASSGQEIRWTAATLAAQQQLLTELTTRGVVIHPEFRFTRVLNGFSAAVDPRAIPVLERAPEVAGVYPVRVAYPARATPPRDLFVRGLGHRLDVSLGGYDGAGVLIALLDTGVDLSAPFLHGHVLDGIDVVGGGANARARRRPTGARQLERHGTEMAGLLVGAGGPAGLAGVASGSTLLPIRVAGWQRDESGGYSVYARTDQILEGLENAVDPNGDGDAHDAARVALVPLAEPFASFSDDPLARAARGAQRLDTLVVAPAGNDGPAGPAFGNVSAPGGAPAVLTVGAADLRQQAQVVQVVLRSGLRVFLDREIALAGAFAPRRPLRLTLVAPRRLLDASGYSRVAGKAVLLPATSSPEQLSAAAAAAGAEVVLLHGNGLPAGALGLDEEAPVPVLAVPETTARQLLAAARGGDPVEVAVGTGRTRANVRSGRVAAFSSWGLGFDGQPKPDLLAPGVALTTAEPAPGARTSQFGTVNGSSAAAAAVAGAAALLLEARPNLDAAALKSVLAGSAHRIAAEPVQAQGTGVVDTLAAAAVELSTEPSALSFGRVRGDGWKGARTLVVRNLSSRTLTVFASAGQGRKAPLPLTVAPGRFTLAPGRARALVVHARVGTRLPDTPSAGGLVTLTPLGGEPLRVAWSAVLAPAPADLVGGVTLSAASFVPSDTAPAVLRLRAGRLVHLDDGDEIQPVQRLDLELSTAAGTPLGLLARLRDLLPSRLAFGLTGRGPKGSLLPPGDYRLSILGWPTAGGRPSVAVVRFTIRRRR